VGTVPTVTGASPQIYYPFTAGAYVSGQSTDWDTSAMSMPAACTFDRLYVIAMPTQAVPASSVTLTITLFKSPAGGGSPTAQSVTVTVTTGTSQFVAIRGQDTAHSFAVVAGDEVAYGVSINTAGTNVRFQVTTRCI
jgi:hypothetical protein